MTSRSKPTCCQIFTLATILISSEEPSEPMETYPANLKDTANTFQRNSSANTLPTSNHTNHTNNLKRATMKPNYWGMDNDLGIGINVVKEDLNITWDVFFPSK